MTQMSPQKVKKIHQLPERTVPFSHNVPNQPCILVREQVSDIVFGLCLPRQEGQNHFSWTTHTAAESCERRGRTRQDKFNVSLQFRFTIHVQKFLSAHSYLKMACSPDLFVVQEVKMTKEKPDCIGPLGKSWCSGSQDLRLFVHKSKDSEI